jgi:hypothetical protein
MIRQLTSAFLCVLALAGCGDKSPLKAGGGSNTNKKEVNKTASGSDGSGSDSSTSGSDASGSGASTSGSGDDTIDTASGDQPEVVINLEAVEGTAMQVKNVNLLRSSISECLDIEVANKSVFNINYDMIIGQTPADPDKGKVLFYNGDCKVGNDITGCLKADLYDPDAVAGDTVSSNALSVSYLQALGTVANVIAHNCDTDGKCKCDDDKVAEGLITRCFPYLTDAAFDAAHDFLVQTCKSPAGSTPGDAAKARRQGIANIIGSVGFAKARE